MGKGNRTLWENEEERVGDAVITGLVTFLGETNAPMKEGKRMDLLQFLQCDIYLRLPEVI